MSPVAGAGSNEGAAFPGAVPDVTAAWGGRGFVEQRRNPIPRPHRPPRPRPGRAVRAPPSWRWPTLPGVYP